MKNKTQENEKKTIIPKQKKQRSVKKEKSAVTKKTAKKTRNSSMAVKLVAILVLMVAVTMVSNVINYDAMVKMNHSIKDVTDSKVPDLQNAYNIQYSLEAVQKDFYRYLATTKGETSHTEARNDYAADREAVADLVQQMYDATEGDGQKQIMQKIYDGVNNVLERMDNAMEKYDDGKTGKVSIEVNVIRVCMEEVAMRYLDLAHKLEEGLTARLMAEGMPEKQARAKASKQANEDARFVLPNACETKMVVTMNARSLQNFFHLRCCSRAQWEIRELAEKMFELVYPVAPHIFAKSGPACVSGPCPEGKMCCGKTAEVRAKYASIKEAAGV